MGRRRGPSDERLRDSVWGADSGSKVFRPKDGGWAPTPRTIPIISVLINFLSGKHANSGAIYQVLWAHSRNGHVDVDPQLFSLEAGFSRNHTAYRFNVRARVLADLGFIATKPMGQREFARILLLDPHPVVVGLHKEGRTDLPGWYERYQDICRLAGMEWE